VRKSNEFNYYPESLNSTGPLRRVGSAFSMKFSQSTLSNNLSAISNERYYIKPFDFKRGKLNSEYKEKELIEWLDGMELSEMANPLLNEGFDVQSLIEELRPNIELLKEAGVSLEGNIFRILVKVEID
jgi:hypothetical protein